MRFRIPLFCGLALLLIGLAARATVIPGGAPRSLYFQHAADAERRIGDRAGAERLMLYAALPPEFPAELSEEAKAVHPYEARQYDELRRRVRQAMIRRDYPAEDQWRVDRAEADLRLVAYELEQDTAATMDLVRRFINDAAWYALDHHIAVTLDEPEPPRVAISADPIRVEKGQETLLHWTSQNARQAWLNGEEVSVTGSRRVRLDEDREFFIVVVNQDGQASDATRVEVIRPYVPPVIVVPPSAWISVSPASVERGECAWLSWRTTDATAAEIDGEEVNLQGRREICPGKDETYHLVAHGPGGTASALASIRVLLPPPVSYGILFDFDESAIREDAVDTMRQVARLLRQDPSLKMRVIGHTDGKGSDAYNRALGARRAEAVRDYFVTRFGIDPGRFVLESRGKSEPVAPNTLPNGADDPEGRQRNRRAVFVEVR